ncbi:MAG: four helix bundle protein [Gracilimonas sp.]|uniref:four helix bundle protein n=1 Tax=Gracilimonas sp. TaxID=1974203 RepID=UPI0019C2C129|nr:four helix bundle protein [Gracilimonas sp.]MBD3616729.1 four helix bundle protein [Gracilimonas sp.]
MHQFKELTVWQKAVDLATDAYRYTKNFPAEEKFGLTSQIRRSVVSISSNIAEGAGRKSKKEFKHFLHIAYGSASELENEHYKMLSEKITEIQKMIYSLSKSLK